MPRFAMVAGLMLGCMIALSSGAVGAEMVWSSETSGAGDSGAGDGPTATLWLGIPETDAMQFIATCSLKSSGTSLSAVFGYDITGMREGARKTLELRSAGYRQDWDGAVFGTEIEEGVAGIRLDLGIDDPLWQMMQTVSLLSYGLAGAAPSRLSLRGAPDAVESFLTNCREIVAAAGTGPSGTQAGDHADDMPFEAGSWGGIVRSGPGMDFPRVASLDEGEPIQVLERTEVMMNGYPWFKISYRGGRKGYKWGGILCAFGAERDGLFQTCPDAKASGADADNEVSYTCHDEGMPMTVALGEDGKGSYATVTHELSGTVRLDQVVSGSGVRYSNGTYDLHMKAKSAVFAWSDGQHACEQD